MSNRSTINRYAIMLSDGTLITSAGLEPSRSVWTPGDLTGRGVTCSVGLLSYVTAEDGGVATFADINTDSRPTFTIRAHPELTFALIESKDGSYTWLDADGRQPVWRHGGPTSGMDRHVSVRVHCDGYRHEFANGPFGQLVRLADEFSDMKDVMVTRDKQTRAVMRASLRSGDARFAGRERSEMTDAHGSEVRVDVWPIITRVPVGPWGDIHRGAQSYRLSVGPEARPSAAQLQILQQAAKETQEAYELRSMAVAPEDQAIVLCLLEEGKTIYRPISDYRERFVATMRQRVQAALEMPDAPSSLWLHLATPGVASWMSFQDCLEAAVRDGEIIRPIDTDLGTGLSVYRKQDQ